MSTAMPPLAPEAPAPQPAAGLSEGSRLISIFFSPRKTFEDIRRKSSWWAPWVVTAVFSILFGLVAVQKIDLVNFSRQQIESSKIAQQQFDNLTPEQQAQNLRIRAMFSKVLFFAGPVIGLIFGLILAAILMGVFNFGFAAEVTFGQAMAIVFYSYLPRIVPAILLSIILLASADPNSINLLQNPLATNPAFFMDPHGNKFLYTLAGWLDIISIWTLVLLGIGFATVSKKKLKSSTAITILAVLYGIIGLASAAIASAF